MKFFQKYSCEKENLPDIYVNFIVLAILTYVYCIPVYTHLGALFKKHHLTFAIFI